MESTNIYNVAIGCFLMGLGWYVRRITPAKDIQKKFFWLCFFLSTWMFFHGFRVLLSDEYRELALNWTLLPILCVPFCLFGIVTSLFTPEKNIQNLQNKTINYGILIYLLGSAFFCNAVEIKDPEKFSYKPTINYHLIIAYCAFFIAYSCYIMVSSVFRRRGDLRVRAFLLALGTVLALIVSIICVYVLPLLGFFYASKSAFGFVPFSLLWAIAILHYDVFEIRERKLEGDYLPFLSRLSTGFMLSLYHVLDPIGYNLRLEDSKLNVTIGMLFDDYYLRKSKNLNPSIRAKKITERFGHRIK
ncbi:LIC10906 family membrane protein [Leptospira stimsonii]|uniref:Histidine kinase N-terminal 7TM region domain-containing protein n=1 Tax=Leptospira stimsonii TaxID=2202203 RepID=A0ABY2N5A2_9LEPT|nr:histidine kinase N-terminal 7TM domain-containing protein [Leptospira stimsonii]TGK10387.1 hypothetical protein EHO98_23030 [Leptospira stimsonii]TGM17269.1 hypothetical protein EHQ90_07765 [Leptospira stimsonii]